MSDTTVSRVNFSAAELREAKSLDDLMRLSETINGPAIAAADALGDGFTLEKDKSKLVGIDLFLISWTFTDRTENGQEIHFVTVRAVTTNNRRVIFNDGSTGIYAQLQDVSKRTGRYGGMAVKDGLRVSQYLADVVNHKTGEIKKEPATTYYLNA